MKCKYFLILLPITCLLIDTQAIGKVYTSNTQAIYKLWSGHDKIRSQSGISRYPGSNSYLFTTLFLGGKTDWKEACPPSFVIDPREQIGESER